MQVAARLILVNKWKQCILQEKEEEEAKASTSCRHFIENTRETERELPIHE